MEAVSAPCRACQNQLRKYDRRWAMSRKSHLLHPNYISGYGGNVPVNMRWMGEQDARENRDFFNMCIAPVNTFYVVHSRQPIPDGSYVLPRIHAQLPGPMLHPRAIYEPHPLVGGGAVICHHAHPMHPMLASNDPSAAPCTPTCANPGSPGAVPGCMPCYPATCAAARGPDYRLTPPTQQSVGLRHADKL